MRPTRLIAFLPPFTLLILVALTGGMNAVGRKPDFRGRAPIAGAASRAATLATARRRSELKAVLKRYVGLQGAARRRATYTVSRPTSEEAIVNQRLALLRSWPDFTVVSLEERRSGFTVALLEHDGSTLKAWLLATPEGWKFVGLVKPPA